MGPVDVVVVRTESGLQGRLGVLEVNRDTQLKATYVPNRGLLFLPSGAAFTSSSYISSGQGGRIVWRELGDVPKWGSNPAEPVCRFLLVENAASRDGLSARIGVDLARSDLLFLREVGVGLTVMGDLVVDPPIG